MTIRLKIKGLVTTKTQFLDEEEIFVQYTADQEGKTLSLSTDDVVLSVPFEPIEEAIKGERK